LEPSVLYPDETVTVTVTVDPPPEVDATVVVDFDSWFYDLPLTIAAGTTTASWLLKVDVWRAPEGLYSATARYGGTPNYAPSASPERSFTIRRDPSTLTVAMAPSPATLGEPVTMDVAVSPAPPDLMQVGIDVLAMFPMGPSRAAAATLTHGSGTYTLATVDLVPGHYRVTFSFNGTEHIAPPPDVVRELVILGPPRPPTASAPVVGFVVGGRVPPSGVGVRISWSGSAGSDQIARWELERSTDGGPWVAEAAGTATLRNVVLGSAHKTRFRVRAVDTEGRASDWAVGTAVGATAIEETSSAVRYSGAWWRGVNDAYHGGRLVCARGAGSSATARFYGRSVAWIAALGPTRARARVSVDGTAVATVNLRAATGSSRVLVFRRTWSTNATHRIRIVPLDRGSRARVDLDAILVLR
jgi:hypothetical protein